MRIGRNLPLPSLPWTILVAGSRGVRNEEVKFSLGRKSVRKGGVLILSLHLVIIQSWQYIPLVGSVLPKMVIDRCHPCLYLTKFFHLISAFLKTGIRVAGWAFGS